MTQEQAREILIHISASACEIVKGCEAAQHAPIEHADLLALTEALGELHARAVELAVAFEPVAKAAE